MATAGALLVSFFRRRPGDVFLLGDTTLLHALTGRWPVSPVLWWHLQLTVPWRGRRTSPAFQRELVDRIEGVRFVILEGEHTQMGVGLRQLPALAAVVLSPENREFLPLP